MLVAPPGRFPTARGAEHLDPDGTWPYLDRTVHGITRLTPAIDKM
jgi:hypothetical protein